MTKPLSNKQTVEETRQSRSAQYGSMEDMANMTQEIFDALKKGASYDEWTPMHIECVHMIVHKLARMACGNHMYSDNPHDIAGYAQLLDNWMVKANKENDDE